MLNDVLFLKYDLAHKQDILGNLVYIYIYLLIIYLVTKPLSLCGLICVQY